MATPKSSSKSSDKSITLEVTPPDFRMVEFLIEGDAPYCQQAMSARDKEEMIKAQKAGSTAKSKKARVPKDFDARFREATHVSNDGWPGIPSAAFRSAMIDACRCVGVTMTHAKLAVFVIPDGWDRDSMDPLTKITRGEPEKLESALRNANFSMDIRARPVWKPGWQAIVTLRYDAGMIEANDVANLLLRVGAQVGIGEGRPNSRRCAGIGWGTFKIVG